MKHYIVKCAARFDVVVQAEDVESARVAAEARGLSLLRDAGNPEVSADVPSPLIPVAEIHFRNTVRAKGLT